MLGRCYEHQGKNETFRLIQITDPHLFKDEGGELLGLNTQQSFAQVLEEIKTSSFPYELVLATGDLVQDRKTESYQRFSQQIISLSKPVLWTTGNHDYLPDMYEVLGQYSEKIFSEKQILLGDTWQILLLDSQVYGVPYGELSVNQLLWLERCLKTGSKRFTLLVLHHHVFSTHSAWLDQHNLRNTYDFLNVIKKYANVRAILCGHIHQAVDSIWQGYQVMATPSTCIQFKPYCHHFTLDTEQPGWREITLLPNGEVETQVKRIQQKTFLPNLMGEGYE